MFSFIRLILAALLLCLGTSCSITGAHVEPDPAPAIISNVPIWDIDQAAYDQMVPGQGLIRISRADQRLTLLDEQRRPVLQTDCSTGKPGKETPSGDFRVLEKLADKSSNKYGSYVSATTGEVLAPRSWLVEMPPGSRYVGTPMPYWLRLTWTGVGIHVGSFEPGVRTSMGCIRVPAQAQERLFQKVTVGTRVRIE